MLSGSVAGLAGPALAGPLFTRRLNFLSYVITSEPYSRIQNVANVADEFVSKSERRLQVFGNFLGILLLLLYTFVKLCPEKSK